MSNHSAERALLVLTERAVTVRAELEPTAWVVLEQLALRATHVDGQATSQQSVRTLAEALGRSKDAVARAVRQLVAAGLVERLNSRHGFSGRFTGGHYVIDLRTAGLRLPNELDVRSQPVPFGPATPPVPGDARPDTPPPSATPSAPTPAPSSSPAPSGRLW